LNIIEGLTYAFGGGMVVHYLNGNSESAVKYLTYAIACAILNAVIKTIRSK